MRGWLYDRMAAPVTTSWYEAALERTPRGEHLLDVGIGTGRALAAHAARVHDNDLRITGLDIDHLSVAPAALLPEIKNVIRKISFADAQEAAQAILDCEDPDSAFETVQKYNQKLIPEISERHARQIKR